MRNRQLGSNLGLLLLASQVFRLGIDNIPPTTLVTLGLNVYLFLFPVKPILQTCVSVQQAYWRGDWHRILLSPFHHMDDWHLYYNMASFLWKGVNLERRVGTAHFAYLLSVFSLLTGLVYLLLEAGLTELTDDSSFSMQCAVGFSGVLFGLKVVNNYYNPGGVTYIMGVPVAKRFACWAELVLIHILNPGTSFVGHLSGILVGLLYTTGPLKTLMKSCADFVSGDGNYSRSRTHYSSSGYSGYGTSYRQPHVGQDSYYRAEPSAPPQHLYTAGLSEQEQYHAAIQASLQQTGRRVHSRPSYGFNTHSELTMEEIRQQRLKRFDVKQSQRRQLSS